MLKFIKKSPDLLVEVSDAAVVGGATNPVPRRACAGPTPARDAGADAGGKAVSKGGGGR